MTKKVHKQKYLSLSQLRILLLSKDKMGLKVKTLKFWAFTEKSNF